MKNTSSRLHYYMAESHSSAHDFPILMVTLIGEISQSNSSDHIQCLEEISKSTAKWVIVNFRDVFSRANLPNQDPSLFVCDDAFAQFIDQLRKKIHSRNGHLRLSGIPLTVRQFLEERQLILQNELANNLKEALASLPQREK